MSSTSELELQRASVFSSAVHNLILSPVILGKSSRLRNTQPEINSVPAHKVSGYYTLSERVCIVDHPRDGRYTSIRQIQIRRPRPPRCGPTRDVSVII